MTWWVFLRGQLTPRRLAQAAILLEMAVIGRALAEVYRLRSVEGPAFTLESALAWITGALIALGFLALSTILYFAGRERLAGGAAIFMIVVLIGYKVVAIGSG